MLFHITQHHSSELCPKNAGGSKTLYDPKVEGVKRLAMYGAFHTELSPRPAKCPRFSGSRICWQRPSSAAVAHLGVRLQTDFVRRGRKQETKQQKRKVKHHG